MRGCAGSGKSTWIKNNLPKATVFSTDHYFMKDGVYQFDPKLLGTNHNLCLRDYTCALINKIPEIVVDNTNVKVFEIAPFYRLAEAMGYAVKIVWIHCTWEVAAARNTHGVPPETVRQMSRSFEPLPLWWNLENVYVS